MRWLLLLVAMLCIAPHTFAQFIATITASGSTTFCQGNSVLLVANANADTYQWLQNGTPIAGANDDTLIVNAAGSYEVLIDSAGYSDTSLPEVVTVNTIPAQPGPISGPTGACVGTSQPFSVSPVAGATGYIWQGSVLFDTTLIPSVTCSVVTAQNFQYHTISVRALNDCGVSQPVSTQLNVYGPPQIDGHSPYPRDISDMMGRVCPPNQYTLFPVIHGFVGGNTSPYTYQWCLNGVSIPGATQKEYVISHGGNYSVKIITQYCGTYTVPKYVFQNMPNSITISPSGPLNFCLGNATPLNVVFDMTGVNESFDWEWTNASKPASVTGSENSYSILPDTSGAYLIYIKYQDWGYCELWSNIVSVTIPPPLEVTQVDDTLFATPGYSSYQWLEGNVPISGATSQSHVLTYDGIYSVEAVYSNGCTESSDTLDPVFRLAQNGGDTGGGPRDEINIYPNPNAGAFTLTARVPKENQSASVTITDIAGHILFTKHAVVKDGMIEEKIDFKDDIGRMCIIKVKAKGCNKTTSFLKQ